MKLLCQKIKSHMCLEIFQSTNDTNRRGQGVLFQRFLACEQALPLGDIVKSRRTRGTREETRKRGTGGRYLAASPLALATRFARPNRRKEVDRKWYPNVNKCSEKLGFENFFLEWPKGR